jgi:predicted aspartyl protease
MTVYGITRASTRKQQASPEVQAEMIRKHCATVGLNVGVARIEFMGDVVGATVIFGEEDCEPILGVAALESAGIEVDPVSQRLKRLPAVRLKGLRRG